DFIQLESEDDHRGSAPPWPARLEVFGLVVASELMRVPTGRVAPVTDLQNCEFWSGPQLCDRVTTTKTIYHGGSVLYGEVRSGRGVDAGMVTRGKAGPC